MSDPWDWPSDDDPAHHPDHLPSQLDETGWDDNLPPAVDGTDLSGGFDDPDTPVDLGELDEPPHGTDLDHPDPAAGHWPDLGYGDDLADDAGWPDSPQDSTGPDPEPGTPAPAGDGWEAALGADPDLPDSEPDELGWTPPAPVPTLDFTAPEPVDGFPWADPADLGPAEGTAPEPVGPLDTPTPADLADYAALDLPADADPWTVLAGSDDPATSALARFWGTPPH
jgi:hypothetical protein